jgi:putative endonuclease
MYWVYFLYSEIENNTYIGCTKNLKKRIKEHQNGLVESTKNRRPLILIYKEEYDTLSLARRREGYFKSLYRSKERKRIVKECLKKNEQKILIEPYA